MSATTTNLGLTKLLLTDPADITALNPNWDFIDKHMFDGKVKRLTSSDDLDQIRTPGFYQWTGNPINHPGGSNLGNMIVIGTGDDGCVRQIIFSNATRITTTTSQPNAVCSAWRNMDNSDISNWVWENPPMEVGVEYLIAENYVSENGRSAHVYATFKPDGIIHKRTVQGIDITPITYGTEDLTVGISELTTGCLYFVYE